ncbi:mandelate racemase/muconate lactonizing enzyme family protein [Treponema primitia ZAS-2]|uniref:Dipeptide epimerase n=1 Tax=Treponema primitia (strain ATCC BAA-887 / DSM 12427 / ZAS-2) TaxID=545694 RepID=F5YQR9_TREPZ|nr:dipeptide epimerase [Treponema primitia]AEF85421.1 mandelate racemase/muconate lactonizing enzyme family protein [Treponema primitia ZAS-2]
MKITKINVKPVSVALQEPLRISLGLITHSISAVTSIETDEGLTGYGEGSPGILITGETLAGAVEAIGIFEKDLIGTDPLDIEKVHYIMNRIAAHAPSAKTAIDIACYDLLGKKAGLPVYKLLGGNEDHLITDITIGIGDPEQSAGKAKKYIEAGFDTIKTKVGTGFEEDIARVKAIRNAVGPTVKIRLDANQGWSPKTAIRMINRLAEYDIELVEQPVPYYNIDGLAYVTKHSPIPIMSDESAFDSKDVLRLIREHAVDLVNIKLMKCGGIHEALKINSICEAAGVECMLGCMVEESNIGITAAASLGAAVRNITRFDLDAAFGLKELPIEGGVDLSKNKLLTLSAAPGFGFKK